MSVLKLVVKIKSLSTRSNLHEKNKPKHTKATIPYELRRGTE